MNDNTTTEPVTSGRRETESMATRGMTMRQALLILKIISASMTVLAFLLAQNIDQPGFVGGLLLALNLVVICELLNAAYKLGRLDKGANG
jgi:hypothetical protein